MTNLNNLTLDFGNNKINNKIFEIYIDCIQHLHNLEYLKLNLEQNQLRYSINKKQNILQII